MEKDRRRSNQYSKTPEGRQKQNEQKRRYLPLVRHIDSVLEEIMVDDELLSLEQISDRIYETKHVRMKASTIENLLSRYAENNGEPPLEKVNDRNYRLTRSFYKTPNEWLIKPIHESSG